jgi:hypothetical protein
MHKRHKMHKRHGKKLFSRTAARVHKKNGRSSPMRGGVRL